VTVLLVAAETPFPPESGTRLRNVHLARRLAAELTVEMVVLGPVGAAEGEPYPVAGVPHRASRARSLAASVLRPYSAAKHDSAALARYVGERAPAVVQAQEVWVVPAALAAGRPVILDAHNVERDLLRSFAAAEPRPLHRARWRWESRKAAAWEGARVREATAVCAMSDHDAAALEGYGAREVLVVPNGVDTTAVSYREPAAGAGLLFVGHYGYQPNAAAARELAGEILPRVRERRPDATLELVGREPPASLERQPPPGVRVTGAVPDVLAHLHSARAVVFPLRSGSGTRLKALEAMAAGVPVISTALGVQGLDVRHGEDVLIGETPAELAELAARVITDDALALRLSAAGRALVERRYDWGAVARPLIELHLRLQGSP